MSRASKITLAASLLTSAAIVYVVHRDQMDERENLHAGVIRDQERILRRERNQTELDEQQLLRQRLEQHQTIASGASSGD